MRFIRTGALIAGALSLTLLLSGCFGAGEADVNPAHNCPGCGPPLGPSPPSPRTAYSASCSIASDYSSLSVTITNTGNTLLGLGVIDVTMYTASGASDGTAQASPGTTLAGFGNSMTFPVTPSGGVPADAASCQARMPFVEP